MKGTLALTFVVCSALAAFAGDGKCWDQGKAKPWEGYNKVVKWESSLAEAQKKARKEEKLLLYFILVGDLDKEGCWAAGDVLRTVTFSDEKVGAALSKDFVCAWKNRKEGFHNCDPASEQSIFQNTGDAFPTRNIVTLFLTPDLQVLHYFSGYFSPALFLKQADFARKLRGELFDADFKVKKGAPEAFKRLHGEAFDALKAEAEKLAKSPDAWKDATADWGTFSYNGQTHEHQQACLWMANSVFQYVSFIHGDFAGKPDVQKSLEQFNKESKVIYWKPAFASVMREDREVKREPGERRILEALPLLSQVEGKYLYGNPFTEE